jgi:hypothetical protein
VHCPDAQTGGRGAAEAGGAALVVAVGSEDDVVAVGSEDDVVACAVEGATEADAGAEDILGKRASDGPCSAAPDPLPAVTLAQPAVARVSATAPAAARPRISPSARDREAPILPDRSRAVS